MTEYLLRATVFRHGENPKKDEAGGVLSALRESYPNQRVDYQRSETLDTDRVIQHDFVTSIAPSPTVLDRRHVSDLEKDLCAEVIVQHAFTAHQRMKLAVFDMDSTLIQQEVIDLLAAYAGVEAQVADITSRTMNGELDFSASLKGRVSLLKDIPETVFNDLKPRLTLTKGADVLLKVLKQAGVKTALLSGGFMPLATFIGHKLKIDHVYANELEVKDGKLTGRLAEGSMIVNAEKKQELLLSIAKSEHIGDAREIMAVGDGANDLLMLRAAGLGVAVNAKPSVQEKAPFKLNCEDLTDMLHVMSLNRQDINAFT